MQSLSKKKKKNKKIKKNSHQKRWQIPGQNAVSKFGVFQSDIMEILKQSKVKRCKDGIKCDQNNKWKQ